MLFRRRPDDRFTQQTRVDPNDSRTRDATGLLPLPRRTDLRPHPAARAPQRGHAAIVLFGGVNGAGKTTLLDAIQLALYGARARCSKRADLAYDEFLRKSIHHGVSESEGAGVSLAFRYASGGEEHLYEVRRSWNVQGGKVREELRVLAGRSADRWHSEHWNQLVEDFFPLEVSQLFFFDAEKIRSLAEDETSSQVLGIGGQVAPRPRHRRAADRRRRCRGSEADEGSWRPPSRGTTAPTSRTGSRSCRSSSTG